uniref:Ig-like domain-containing protein n=1 Tax=Nothoprocta perdicaria TaxID=30464 RepID=A0A8C6ZQM4_NOTPE
FFSWVCTSLRESMFLQALFPFLFLFSLSLLLEPPSFVKKIDPSYLLTPGDSARLQCKVKGSPEIQVTWFKNNKEIRESNTHSMSFVNFVAVLDISEMKVDDSGSYSCEAVNEVGSDSCTTEVVVKGVFFLTFPVKFLGKVFLFLCVEKGKPLILECTFMGTPPISVTWKKNGVKITHSEKCSITTTETSAILEIPSSKLEDQGQYSCHIENDSGQDNCHGAITILGVNKGLPGKLIEINLLLGRSSSVGI